MRELEHPMPAHPLPRRTLRAALAAAVLTASLSGCSVFSERTEQPVAVSPSDAATTAAEVPFGSEFSRDGTYQSHIPVQGLDFVWSVWASKSTPRMAEWRPRGSKYFSFTFQAYDTRRNLRDPFDTKRKVWLERMEVVSQTSTASGQVQSPYNLDEWAPDVTFDPEAVTNGRMGMLITSPKGGFELRNQEIPDMADDTEGVTLMFRAVLHIQQRPGVNRYQRREVTLQLPIAIFASKYPTRPQPVPYNAS